MNAGRFAPSPSGEMHLGNLRTALAAWGAARGSGRDFYLRIDDIDPGRNRGAETQIRDLQALGIEWDGPVRYQSERLERYNQVLQELEERGLTFYCSCSRKDIREAVRAPHTPPTHYPGTCLEKPVPSPPSTPSDRPLAVRLRPPEQKIAVQDAYRSGYEGAVDAFVLRRGDGWPAYNLASVVDDMDWGVDQVVRGADLLTVAPSQTYLGSLLGTWTPLFIHVPLVLGKSGERLAKRDGAVTMSQIDAAPSQIFRYLAKSLGVDECEGPDDFVNRFDFLRVPQAPVLFDEVQM